MAKYRNAGYQLTDLLLLALGDVGVAVVAKQHTSWGEECMELHERPHWIDEMEHRPRRHYQFEPAAGISERRQGS